MPINKENKKKTIDFGWDSEDGEYEVEIKYHWTEEYGKTIGFKGEGDEDFINFPLAMIAEAVEFLYEEEVMPAPARAAAKQMAVTVDSPDQALSNLPIPEIDGQRSAQIAAYDIPSQGIATPQVTSQDTTKGTKEVKAPEPYAVEGTPVGTFSPAPSNAPANLTAKDVAQMGEVGETPPELKDAAQDMMAERAKALAKNQTSESKSKIKPR